MSIFMIAVLVTLLVLGGASIIKKTLGLVDKTLDKANTALDVSDIYLQDWASEAEDRAAIGRARRKHELEQELANVNTQLASKGKSAVTITARNK